MKKFVTLIRREFGFFFKDDTLRSVFILAPILYAVIIGFVYRQGKVEKLPIIVVDTDNTPMSNRVVDLLGDNEKLQIVSLRHENVRTNDEMIDHKAVIAVVIPDRFEADILQKRYPELNVYINTTNVLTANLANQGVQTTLGTLSAGINMQALMKSGMSAQEAQMQYEPFKTNYIRLFNETGNYFTFMWPAILAVVLQQVILLGMAVSFAREYEQGSFRPELVEKAGNAFMALAIKVIPFWILSIPIVAIYYGFHLIFRAPLPEHPLNYVVTTSLFVASCTFLGAFVSALLPTALKATQVLMLLSTPAFLIGGYSWPREAMPMGIRWLADILPLTPFLDAHKTLLIEQGSLHQVVPELRHLIGQIAIYLILSLAVLSIKFRKSRKKG